MSLTEEQYAFRDDMISRLGKDLIGPLVGAEEVIDELPLDRYILGVLWPTSEVDPSPGGTAQNTSSACSADQDLQTEQPDEPDDGGVQPGETGDDSPIAQALMRYPSSTGLTFSVDTRLTPTVALHISAAQYVPEEETEPAERTNDQRSRSRYGADRPKTWRRASTPLVPVEQGLLVPGASTLLLTPGLELYVLVRPAVAGVVTVSAVLRNVNVHQRGEIRDSLAWFQVGLTVRADSASIVDRSRSHGTADDDLESSALLYRNVPNFAIGHGCAAQWTTDPNHPHAVDRIEISFLPRSTVKRARPGGVSSAINLGMAFLSEGETEAIRESLNGLLTEYRHWIEHRRQELQHLTLTSGQLRTAHRHLGRADVAADRIAAGIKRLQEDPLSLKAFRFANEAMCIQRTRQDWIRAGARGSVDTAKIQSWYPFQIAFILLNLDSLADPDHEDRKTADLLWFPTGGGKTEAYLGLIAFTVIRRRLARANAPGVAVIMRYTLRLLTIQQFERAAMLMCSLESLRRKYPEMGSRAFGVGLWIGSAGTPNTLKDARAALNKMGTGGDPPEGNPIQLTKCPWCGTTLDVDNYHVVGGIDSHLSVKCRNKNCEFTLGLPIHVVDEDIYNVRPDLVIGTVDKFAMMAWNENVGKLFASDGLGSPPDLIIQDELHLISGPLGSMVGLYETAIDAACGRHQDNTPRVLPKIIGSTATIRRAEQQIRAVFGRSSAVFPPPGLAPDQSFFAEPASADVLGTREYLGVMAPSTSHASLMVRVYASLLQSAKVIPGSDVVRDPYWTLLGYFNSLRVLGSAQLQVQDDVRLRLKTISGRSEEAEREVKHLSELTSRVNSREIPDRLKNLETSTPDKNADDVVLATNMISVGLDVDRLGLMAVMGQPQSSAEYIQATSRVGRKYPGLVVTIFNAARSRDRSHYESFKPFHEALYRAVEATSATPFAARARDRGLHGVLVSMARLLIPGLRALGAADLAPRYETQLQQMVGLINRRAADSAPEEAAATAEQLDELVRVWVDTAEAQPNMKYFDRKNHQAALLVEPATALADINIDYSVQAAPWPTLQSMREVDAESSLHLIPMRRKS